MKKMIKSVMDRIVDKRVTHYLLQDLKSLEEKKNRYIDILLTKDDASEDEMEEYRSLSDEIDSYKIAIFDINREYLG